MEFNKEKIKRFEEAEVPVDMYGVGNNLLKVNIGFTGDNVMLDGKHEAKQGRKYHPNARLKKVNYPVNG